MDTTQKALALAIYILVMVVVPVILLYRIFKTEDD